MAETDITKQADAEGIRCSAIYLETILKPRYEAVKRLYWSYLTRIDYAHASVMAEQHLLSATEAKQILRALRSLEQDIDQSFQKPGDSFSFQGNDFIADCRLHLLKLLSKDLCDRFFNGRSHKEILHSLFRMALKDRLTFLIGSLLRLSESLIAQCRKDIITVIPSDPVGNSPVPTSWESYLFGISDLLMKSCDQLLSSYRMIDVSPLGSHIEHTIRLNRARLSELLGFRRILDSTQSDIFLNEGYETTYTALQHLCFNIARIASEFLKRIDGKIPHLWWPQEAGVLHDILEEIHSLAALAGNDAAAFVSTSQNFNAPKQQNVYLSLHSRGYHVFDMGMRLINLFDALLRTLKVDDRAFLMIIDRDHLVLNELQTLLLREEQLTPQLSYQIIQKISLYLVDNKLLASQLPFGVFGAIFEEVVERKTILKEERMRNLLSPHVFLNSYGVVKHFPVGLEPSVARFEKMSFNLRTQLDMMINHVNQADQALAKAVDDLIDQDAV